MDIETAFPNRYLKAADLGQRRVIVTIDKVVMEEVGDDEKPVVYFVGTEKVLVLNKTNAAAIQSIAKTRETNEWHGVKILLHPDKTFFGGKRVDCVRVDHPNNTAAPPPPPPVVLEAGADDAPPF